MHPGARRATLDGIGCFDTSDGALTHCRALLGNLSNFWDLGPSSYLEIGAAGVYGENRSESLQTTLYNVFFQFRWRPPNRALYRDFRLGGEYYWARKNFGDPDLRGNGGYVQANFKFSRRMIAGLRFDHLDNYGDDPNINMLVPTLTWWQSEWVFIRLQYNWVKPDGIDSNHTVIAQVVWAVGPHKHETY